MKILVVGAGGVGGYFGARFAQAGQDVVFVARGRHREAIAANGLRIESPRGDLHLDRAAVVERPEEAGPADFVLICTKLWDLEAAAHAARPVVGPDTAVIAFQNGVDKDKVVADTLGADHVVGGVAQIAATIAEPGVIRHAGAMATIIYGELDGAVSARLRAFDAAAQEAPAFEAVLAEDISLEIWKKFSFLAPFSGITCYFREPIGPIRDDPEKRAMLEALVHEAVAVGRAAGVPFGPQREAEAMAFVDGLPAEMKSSMLHDLEAGSRLELDWLTGAVVRLGREHGVATPMSETAYDALEPYKGGR